MHAAQGTFGTRRPDPKGRSRSRSRGGAIGAGARAPRVTFGSTLLGPAVQSLRFSLVSEVLDSGGSARLRMAEPSVLNRESLKLKDGWKARTVEYFGSGPRVALRLRPSRIQQWASLGLCLGTEKFEKCWRNDLHRPQVPIRRRTSVRTSWLGRDVQSDELSNPRAAEWLLGLAVSAGPQEGPKESSSRQS